MRRFAVHAIIVAQFIVIGWFPAVCGAVIRHVPADYLTIVDGIAAAVDGDTVLIAAGTYTGEGNRDLNFQGKAITVMSIGLPEDCVIDCEAAARGFIFNSGETSASKLAGLTITALSAISATARQSLR